jgi:hypothetical protein
MSSADTSSITQSFADWLAVSGLSPLHEHGFASLALPTEHSRVVAMNQELRTTSAPWLPGLTSWPDEHWAIGEDGAGNYFTVLRRDPRAVYFYDHEQRSFETFQPDVREYFDYCTDIERKSRGHAA